MYLSLSNSTNYVSVANRWIAIGCASAKNVSIFIDNAPIGNIVYQVNAYWGDNTMLQALDTGTINAGDELQLNYDYPPTAIFFKITSNPNNSNARLGYIVRF